MTKMVKDKILSKFRIKLSKKAQKIITTAAITFAVFMFFIWLGVGMYISVPAESRSGLWPMYGMYAIFPALIFIFGAKRVYDVVNGGDDDADEKEE